MAAKAGEHWLEERHGQFAKRPVQEHAAFSGKGRRERDRRRRPGRDGHGGSIPSRRGDQAPQLRHNPGMAERLTFLRGRRLVNVAGESHYQEALRALTGNDGSEPVRQEVEAVLTPEPENRYDPNAVKILIAGRHVGYLPREDAAAYRPMLERLTERGRRGACEAMVSARGGTPGASNIGVFLRLPEPDEPSVASDVSRRW